MSDNNWSVYYKSICITQVTATAKKTSYMDANSLATEQQPSINFRSLFIVQTTEGECFVYAF